MTFKKQKLGDIYTFQYGIGNTIENIGGSYPIYGSNGPVGFTDKYNSEDSPVIGHIGAHAGVVNWAPGKHFVTYNGVICKIKDNIDRKFAYYTLLNANLAKRVRGSAQPFVSYDLLRGVGILLPELDEQCKISKVLSDIDNTISTNQKIIGVLENLMREVYEYWFIQFDFPDENGRPYKTSGGKMVYSEELKREIPNGWHMEMLKDLCNIYQPAILSAKNLPKEGKYDVHGANGVIGKYDRYNHEHSEIIVSCRGDCGNIHRTMPKTWITGNAMVVHAKRSYISSEFLKHALYFANIKNITTGSVQGQITQRNLSVIGILVPDFTTLELFNNIAEVVVNEWITLHTINKQLIQLRDWLLPMLMNGQVKVISNDAS